MWKCFSCYFWFALGKHTAEGVLASTWSLGSCCYAGYAFVVELVFEAAFLRANLFHFKHIRQFRHGAVKKWGEYPQMDPKSPFHSGKIHG
jgi:hypothetical protein